MVTARYVGGIATCTNGICKRRYHANTKYPEATFLQKQGCYTAVRGRYPELFQQFGGHGGLTATISPAGPHGPMYAAGQA